MTIAVGGLRDRTNLESWLGGRDSEPFAPSEHEARCFPRDVPTSHASELEEVSECGWVLGTIFELGSSKTPPEPVRFHSGSPLNRNEQ